MTDTANPEVEVEENAGETPALQDDETPALQDDDAPALQDDDAPALQDDDAPAPEEETDEVEHEGKKYRIAKALKPALMFQSDYSRKTAEVAEQRKALEAERTQFAERQKLESDYVTEVGKVNHYNEILAQFDKVDWAALFADADRREQYHQLQYQLQQTRDARDKTIQALNTKVSERNSALQREAAKQFEQFKTEAVSAVPEMANPEYVTKLNTFAQSLGFTPQELGQVRDARIVKALDAAYRGSQIQQKQAAEAKARPAKEAAPLPTVATRSSPQAIRPNDAASDKLSADEWLKRRNEQIRKQRGRP